jgi:branched-chain amino acid transport system permease protein
VFTAIRADEISVAATGKNPAKFKLFAFVLSGLIGGLAGAMYGHSVGGFNVSELLALIISIEVIVAAILGGIGTITGAAIGGLFFYLLRVFLRNLEFTIPVVNVPVGEVYFLLFGIVTLGFLFYLPEGIVPRVVGEWRARSEPQAGEAVADGGKSRGERIVESWTDDLRELFGGERR